MYHKSNRTEPAYVPAGPEPGYSDADDRLGTATPSRQQTSRSEVLIPSELLLRLLCTAQALMPAQPETSEDR